MTRWVASRAQVQINATADYHPKTRAGHSQDGPASHRSEVRSRCPKWTLPWPNLRCIYPRAAVPHSIGCPGPQTQALSVSPSFLRTGSLFIGLLVSGGYLSLGSPSHTFISKASNTKCHSRNQRISCGRFGCIRAAGAYACAFQLASGCPVQRCNGCQAAPTTTHGSLAEVGQDADLAIPYDPLPRCA
jgi:hypothetical protein